MAAALVLIGWRIVSFLAFTATIFGSSQLACKSAEIDLPTNDPQFTIFVAGHSIAKEQRGSYDVLALEGNCRLTQGDLVATADEMILWMERSSTNEPEHPGKIIASFSGHVDLRQGSQQRVEDDHWMGRLFSLYPVQYQAEQEVRRYDIPDLNWNSDPYSTIGLVQFSQPVDGGVGPPALLPPLSLSTPTAAPRVPSVGAGQIWEANNASTQSNSLFPSSGLVISDGSAPGYAASQSTNLTPPLSSLQHSQPQQVVLQAPILADQSFGAKTVEFLQRSPSVPLNMSFANQPDSGEYVGQISGGFRCVAHGISLRNADGSLTEFGTVSLEADNAVVWVRGDATHNPLVGGFVSTPERPIEMYLDGNIVFHQGNRVIYADRMYYNISSEYGMVLSAEVLTPVPQYQGLLRLKADVLQQKDRNHFLAFGAAVTSSRLGVPRYWLQANEVEFTDNREDGDISVFAPVDAHQSTNMQAVARSNYLYLAGVPIGFWPVFTTNLAEPSFYLSSLKYKNDQIFGNQFYTEWNLYQLLGTKGIDGTSARLSVDYLSERGPAIGGNFSYARPTLLFGAPGQGFTDAWFLKDQGRDFLGFGRVNMTPEKETRGQVFSRHRIYFSPQTELLAESGYITDRNALEQFFEQQWDQDKDHASALRLRRYNGNRMFDFWGQGRVNEFFTETEQLPRLDHYWLGQDLLGNRLTWSAATSVGYAHTKVASTPTDPKDLAAFALLPWESDSEGVVARTRQELSLPLSLGAWKVVPFVGGEVGYWHEDVTQSDVTRLVGQAGIRTNLPMWRVYSELDNRLLDINGLAHKVNFSSEVFYADASSDLGRMPLYDPLDDNAQEHFRRRFIFNTFSGVLPPQFDERSYALRTGMQRWVTAGSAEIADDMLQARFGIDHRWQTKRGLPGRQRIVDLISFDTDFIYFPKASRDNFGEEIGVINYDFRYHIGDRLTLLSDGYMDVFSQGLKSISLGAQISRPGRGNAYLGFLSLEGPISANVLNGYANYRMTEKWIFSSSAAFDFGSTGTIGQSLALTRIGETALVQVGMNVDHGRDNVSINFNIEPRFLPTARLGNLAGELIQPAGLLGLE